MKLPTTDSRSTACSQDPRAGRDVGDQREFSHAGLSPRSAGDLHIIAHRASPRRRISRHHRADAGRCRSPAEPPRGDRAWATAPSRYDEAESDNKRSLTLPPWPTRPVVVLAGARPPRCSLAGRSVRSLRGFAPRGARSVLDAFSIRNHCGARRCSGRNHCAGWTMLDVTRPRCRLGASRCAARGGASCS